VPTRPIAASELELNGPGEPGLVSVVIPTYNRGYSIEATLESVLQQTYRTIEVVVVDDGSTDDTARLVGRYATRVRYLFQRNAGPAAARNLGFRHVRGEFIALNDSDDRWQPWKLEAQIRALERCPDAGMVWTDAAPVSSEGEPLGPRYLRQRYSAWQSLQLDCVAERRATLAELCRTAPPELADSSLYVGDFFSPMLLGSLVITPSVVLRRDRLRAAGGFDESLKTSGEDYEFHLRTCWHGPVAFLDVPSVDVRTGSHDQLTAPEMHLHIARNNLTTVTRWLEHGRARVALSPAVVRRRLASSFGWVGEVEMRYGHRSQARRHLLHSLSLNRRQPRRLLWLGATMVPSSALRRVLGWKNAAASAPAEPGERRDTQGSLRG